jgi:hypothetical protein
MARRVAKGVVFDDSVFQKKAKRLAQLLKVDEKQFVKEQTALLARDAAKYTPPFAAFPSKGSSSIGSGKDKKQGEFAMIRDIEYVVTIQDQQAIQWAFSKFGRRPIYKGKKMISKGVILTMSELRRWHRKNRRPSGRTLPLQHDQKYWVSERLLNQYKKSELKRVGISKAALALAAVKLGSKAKVPAWIKRHFGRVSGNGKTAMTSKGPYGLVVSKVPAKYHVERLLPMIYKDRLIKAVARLRRIGKDSAKKSGFKV